MNVIKPPRIFPNPSIIPPIILNVSSKTGLKVKKDLALYQAHIVNENGELSYYDDSMEDINDENLEWGMDYTQFHAPHIRLTQDHEIRISKLEETVAKQEDIIKQQAEIIKLLQTQLKIP